MVTVTAGDGVKEYLASVGKEKIAVGLVPGVTAVCCGGGKAEGYYTPGMLLAGRNAAWDEPHRAFHSNGVDILVSEEALAVCGGEISLTMEKVLFLKKLTLKGIPKRIYEAEYAEKVKAYSAEALPQAAS